MSCRDPATRATLRHRIRRSRCQFCSCAFKLVVGHVRQQADSERSTFAKHGGETNAKHRGVRRIGVSWTAPIRNTCARIRTRSVFSALTSARADFSSECQYPMQRMSAEQGRLNVLLGRRSAPRKALRRGLNRRAASSTPLRNSNASPFLSGRTRVREVDKMLRRNDLFASCR